MKQTIFNPSYYTISEGLHKNKQVIFISFPFNHQHKLHLQNFVNVSWSNSKKCWYCANNNTNRLLFNLSPKVHNINSIHSLSQQNQLAYNAMLQQLQLKAYSTKTIKTYMEEFFQFLLLLKQNHVNTLTYNKIRSYFLYCINTLQMSENHVHSRINAIKFYFEQVLGKEKFLMDLPRPKKPSLLPKAISKSDIKKMLNTITNPKHLLIFKLVYGMGLRVSEVVNLKITDIDSSQMQVLINCAKGKKDRYVNLPHSILQELRSYYKIYKPKHYLFEGQEGKQYAIRSAQSIFTNALRKAKINKKVGIHTLRHSYATHLLEQGTDITLIQKLLGHNSIKTTQIYTRVTNVQLKKIASPLDEL